MSKTISTNVSTGKDGNSIPVWLLWLDSTKDSYRLSYGLSTADFPTAWTGPAFDGSRITRGGMGKVSLACDIGYGGNAGEVNSFSFKLKNTDSWYNTRMTAGEYFENQRVELRLIFADKTSPSWVNAVPIFVGRVDEVKPGDFNSVEFLCLGVWRDRHRTLPQRTLNKAAFASLPDANLDKPYPIHYGRFGTTTARLHRNAIAFEHYAGSDRGHPTDFAKGYVVVHDRNSGTPVGKTMLAAHDINAVNTFHGTGTGNMNLATYSEAQKGFARIAWYYGQPLVDEAYFRREQFSPLNAMREELDIIPAFISQVGTTTGANCVDETTSNETSLQNGQSATYSIGADKIKSFGNSGSSFIAYLKAEVSHTGLVDDQLMITVSKGGASSSPTVVPAGMTGYTITLVTFPIGSITDFQSTDDEELSIVLSYNTIGGNDGGTIKIKNLFLTGPDLGTQDIDEVAWAGDMREFGAWIDSPDHSNSSSSGDLIRNPAYAMESLLCESQEGLGLSTRLTGAAIQCNNATPATPYLDTPHHSSLALTGAITIELWVKVVSLVVSGGGDNNTLVGKVHTIGDLPAPYAVHLNYSNGKVQFSKGNGLVYAFVESSQALSLGVWYHVVCVATAANQLYIYIDGLEKAAQSVSTTIADSGQPLRINAMVNTASRANATYDEVRIWNIAMSESQVNRLYNGGNGYPLPFLTDNCVAWWRFDEEWRAEPDNNTPTGPFTVTDSSGNGRTLSSSNDGSMRIRTGANCKVNYRDSGIYENGSVGNPSHSFDNLAVNKSGFYLAGSILDQSNSKDILAKMAYEFGLAYHVRYDGRENLSRIDALGSPATLTSEHILMNGRTPSFKLSQTKLGDVKTELFLRYKKNYFTGDFEGLKFVRSPDQSTYSADYTNLTSGMTTYWGKCRTAYKNYGQVNRWSYDAEWIRDDATAELFIKFMIDKLTRRAWIAEFDASLRLIDLELLDVRKLDYVLLPSTVKGTNHFRLVAQQIDPNTNKMSVKWLDVGTSSWIPTGDIEGGETPDYPEDPTFDFDADDLTGEDNSNVTSFIERLGGAFTSVGGSTPKLRTEFVNGHNVLEFDGTDDAFESDTLVLSDIMGTESATWFIVAQIKGVATNDATLANNDALLSSKTDMRFGMFMKSAPSAHIAHDDGTLDSASMAITTGEWALFTLAHDATDIDILLNNNTSLVSGTAASGTSTDLGDKIYIGCNPAASQFAQIYIARILCWNRVLTTDEQTLICDYLRTRYAIY